MTELLHRCHSLAAWTFDGTGLRQRLDRRAMFGAAIAAGTATLAFGGRPARALTPEKLPVTLVGAIPPRRGVVPWDSLAKVEIGSGQTPKFPAAIAQLNGHTAIIEGHMMVLDDDEPLDRFLLTAYRAHCPFCMPGGFASIVAIHAARPVNIVGKPLTMRGTLRLLTDERNSQLLYRLDNALPA